ncbi:MAG: hypothetical protein ACTSUE_02025, partial [Promethearchaeota archaeon]
MPILIFLAFMAMVAVAFVWVIVSTYKRQSTWVEMRKQYEKHQSAAMELSFVCKGTAVDMAKVKVPYDRVIEITTYTKPYVCIQDQGEIEYASGKEYSYRTEYYHVISVDPKEFAMELQKCVNDNLSDIEDARIHWEHIMEKLMNITEMISCENKTEGDSEEEFDECMLVVYKPITKKEYQSESDYSLKTVLLRFQPFSMDIESAVKEVPKEFEEE